MGDNSKKNENGKTKYITLKEAGEYSGYSADYIGQLIRKKKLVGKQVFSNIAWVTTEEALREYMKNSKNGSTNGNRKQTENVLEKIKRLKTEFLFELEFAHFYRTVLYVAIFLSIIFSLVLFYILSVTIDGALEKRAIQNASIELAE